MCVCVSICGNSHGDKAGIISKAKSLTFAVNFVAFPSLFISVRKIAKIVFFNVFFFFSGAVPSVERMHISTLMCKEE